VSSSTERLPDEIAAAPTAPATGARARPVAPGAAPGCASGATGSATGAWCCSRSLVVLSLFAELLSNDKPLVVRYEGQTTSRARATIRDHLRRRLRDAGRLPRPLHPARSSPQGGNWAVYPPNPYGRDTLNYFAKAPNPAPPSRENWLRHRRPRPRPAGAAALRLPRQRAVRLALTVIGVVLGILTGAVQGYFGGKTDLAFQRFIEIWGSMPELYLLIIFSADVRAQRRAAAAAAVAVRLDGPVRLRARRVPAQPQMDYVRAARALGVATCQIMWRHILPNSMTPVVTFLPFRMSAAILALTSLDFLGLGVPPARRRWANCWPGQGQPRRLVDLAVHLRRAGGHAAAADLHGRRAARCARSAQGGQMSGRALLTCATCALRSAARRSCTASASIAPGEKLALVGESGSGKTVTALSPAAAGAERQLSGSARSRSAGRATCWSAPERRAARHPRQGHRDDLPGADDGAEPAVHGRRPDRRNLQLQEGLSGAGLGRAVRAAGRHRHPEPRGGRRLPAPALGRPAPARHDRHGAGLPAAPAAGRRAHHGAGRHDARADPRTAGRPAAPDRHGGAADHARPEPGAQVRRPRRGDGERPPGGAGPVGRPCSPQPQHPTPAS
jgi:microcin C transport system permease protein